MIRYLFLSLILLLYTPVFSNTPDEIFITHKNTVGIWNTKLKKYVYEDFLNKNLTFSFSNNKIYVNDEVKTCYIINKVLLNNYKELKLSCKDAKKTYIFIVDKTTKSINLFFENMMLVYR
jgi:hypothetical protein